MKLAHVLIACGVLVVGGAPLTVRANDEIKLRGAGKTRDELSAMQLKPFDNALWSDLSSWTNGDAFKPEDAEGKVVMIVTWASWYPISHRAMRAAQTAYSQHKDQGLIVLGVHNPRGFDAAVANAKDLGVTFPIAEDKDGKFRTALKAGQDANVYFIDRAGHLRFAQVDTVSITAAADLLVKETKEQAMSIPGSLADKAAAAEKEKWLTRDPTGIAPGDWPTVEIKEIDEEAYKAVKWPFMVGKVEQDKILDKITNTPPTVTLAEENWFPSRPKTNGKIVVMYLFDPQDTDMQNVIPVMNRLQDRFRRDVIVIGQAAKIGTTVLNPPQDEADKLTQRNSTMLKQLMVSRGINHYMQATPFKGEQWELGNAGSNIPVFGQSRREMGTAVIVSTDNKVRWIGDPYGSGLKLALEHIISADPGTQARRKAEEAKVKSK